MTIIVRTRILIIFVMKCKFLIFSNKIMKSIGFEIGELARWEEACVNLRDGNRVRVVKGSYTHHKILEVSNLGIIRCAMKKGVSKTEICFERDFRHGVKISNAIDYTRIKPIICRLKGSNSLRRGNSLDLYGYEECKYMLNEFSFLFQGSGKGIAWSEFEVVEFVPVHVGF